MHEKKCALKQIDSSKNSHTKPCITQTLVTKISTEMRMNGYGSNHSLAIKLFFLAPFRQCTKSNQSTGCERMIQ